MEHILEAGIFNTFYFWASEILFQTKISCLLNYSFWDILKSLRWLLFRLLRENIYLYINATVHWGKFWQKLANKCIFCIVCVTLINVTTPLCLVEEHVLDTEVANGMWLQLRLQGTTVYFVLHTVKKTNSMSQNVKEVWFPFTIYFCNSSFQCAFHIKRLAVEKRALKT